MQCSNGHWMQEVARRRTQANREEVVYVMQRIKHFNREGSEYWTEIKVPDLLERTVEVDLVEYRCVQCGETAVKEVDVAA